MGVELTLSDTRATRKRLREIRARVTVPDRGWKRVGIYLSRELNKQFSTRGARFGTPWKPLAASTIKEKRAKGFTQAPLVRTGDMKRGFTQRPMDIFETRGMTARFGSSSKIAAYQHYGTKRNGRTHIPARTIIKVTPEVRKEVRDILKRFIVKDET